MISLPISLKNKNQKPPEATRRDLTDPTTSVRLLVPGSSSSASHYSVQAPNKIKPYYFRELDPNLPAQDHQASNFPFSLLHR